MEANQIIIIAVITSIILSIIVGFIVLTIIKHKYPAILTKKIYFESLFNYNINFTPEVIYFITNALTNPALYNNEDLCISIDYTNIQDVTFGVYDNLKNDIYDYRINIKEKTLGYVELIFEKYSSFNSVKLFISNMIDDDINMNPIREYKESIHINNKL